MFKKIELALPIADLAALLVERLARVKNDDDAVPRNIRDLAVLLELDHQVRNGGFAQYFFNSSCLQAFDAWFAAETVAPAAREILSAALRRLGVEFAVNLDLASVIASGGAAALGPAYGSLLSIYKAQHEASGELVARFAAFRDRLALPCCDSEGFDALNIRFFGETNIAREIADAIRSSPDAYVSA